MKRTAEIVFTVIGAVFFGLAIAIGAVFANMGNNPQARAELESILSQDPNVDPDQISIDQLMSAMTTGAWTVLAAGIAAVVIGILCIVFLKGNKKPKAAGIILIVAGVLLTFATFGVGLFGGIAYLIAGIVALVRKPKQPVVDEEPAETY
ncbi:DUF4064 domain-containing protein [Halobacillus sp. A5]|uniref:DUF4064 domain-containing protein n=1 Tax=Halobacillus sp. A5 TaxID=2880263 RepID=UPI0020A6A62E|nr:DUF4064 domain-containing protein [Halobacillus sp. A5]MCP3029353.1 DUF4064 domain-containing protein [Halobacillus sp. A5]